MAKKKSNQITYSTAENFNPLEDYNVGAQSPILVNGEFSGVNRRISSQNSNNPIDRFDFKNFNEDLQGSNERVNAPVTYSQPTARYETKDSARIAAQHNAGITYDKDIGYVPKAGRVPSTPEQITQRSRDNTAAREAANTPADMAAYRAKTYEKEANRQRAAGNIESANRWKQAAAEETTKARQLGYKGDIAKATIKDPTAKPKPPTATAGAPKPAPASTSKPQPTASTSTANTSATPKTPEQFDREWLGDNIKKGLQGIEKSAETRQKVVDDLAHNEKVRNKQAEAADTREVEKRWRDKAAKATTPEQKELALQMAAEYADKAKKQEQGVKDLQAAKVPDIKPISKNKDGQTPTDPMEKLIADIPTLNNSSAYNNGGAGGGSGATGFFTRSDGTVVPITA